MSPLPEDTDLTPQVTSSPQADPSLHTDPSLLPAASPQADGSLADGLPVGDPSAGPTSPETVTPATPAPDGHLVVQRFATAIAELQQARAMLAAELAALRARRQPPQSS